MDKTWFNIFQPYAKEANITVEQAEEIFRSQFKFINETYNNHILSKEGPPPVILLPNIGRFYPKMPNVRRILAKLNQPNNDKDTDQQDTTEEV